MTTGQLRVAVLQGGHSAEADVSRRSAAEIAGALAESGHTATLIELDDSRNELSAIRQLLDHPYDVVFPALHGPPGEDGTVQGLLEMLGMAYVGSPVRGSALAMDKAVAKQIFLRAGLPVSEDIIVRADADADTVARNIVRRFKHGVVIKPMNQGSAIGVTPLPDAGTNPDEIATALRDGLKYGDCLVEPFIKGKEITVGVLQRGAELIPHPVIEIRTAAEQWYDYQNRYTEGQSEHIIPAELNAETNARLQQIALEAHTALGLRDLSRADFIVSNDEAITLLEVNTLPGMTPTSLYPDGARALGYSFAALLDLLVNQAVERHASLTGARLV
jgi:D-alanine-D-alanine ligase